MGVGRSGEYDATVAGALAFGIGAVFLVVGRSELFSENFFDPVAAAIDEGGAGAWGRLLITLTHSAQVKASSPSS